MSRNTLSKQLRERLAKEVDAVAFISKVANGHPVTLVGPAGGTVGSFTPSMAQVYEMNVWVAERLVPKLRDVAVTVDVEQGLAERVRAARARLVGEGGASSARLEPKEGVGPSKGVGGACSLSTYHTHADAYDPGAPPEAIPQGENPRLLEIPAGIGTTGIMEAIRQKKAAEKIIDAEFSAVPAEEATTPMADELLGTERTEDPSVERTPEDRIRRAHQEALKTAPAAPTSAEDELLGGL